MAIQNIEVEKLKYIFNMHKSIKSVLIFIKMMIISIFFYNKIFYFAV